MKRNNAVLKITGLLILCFVSLVIIFSFGDVHLTEDQARERAIERLDGFCKNSKTDKSLLSGPEYIGSSSTGYTFDWVGPYRNEGETIITIWVSLDGATEVTLEKANEAK